MDEGGAVVRKIVFDGYIVSIGDKGSEISTTEYNSILKAIDNKPVAPEGFVYKLKDNAEWELCKEEASGGM